LQLKLLSLFLDVLGLRVYLRAVLLRVQPSEGLRNLLKRLSNMRPALSRHLIMFDVFGLAVFLYLCCLYLSLLFKVALIRK
jgi:hypothetical protein